MCYLPARDFRGGISLQKAFEKDEKATTEKSRREKAPSESGTVRADATCPLKIPPEPPTERGRFNV